MARLVKFLAPWWDPEEDERKDQRSLALAAKVDRQLDRVEQANADTAHRSELRDAMREISNRLDAD